MVSVFGPAAGASRGHVTVLLSLVLLASSCAQEDTAQQDTGADADVERVMLSPTATPADSQTVSWRGAEATDPAVEIAPADDPGDTTQVAATATAEEHGTFYRATATDLAPDTEYQYRVGTEGGFGDWHRFTTAADHAEPFTFLYFGDIQTDIDTDAAPVIRAGLEAEPDAELMVHVGDMVDDADSESEWDDWYDAFGLETLAGTNQVAAVGNHEYDDDLSAYWQPQFPTAGNGPQTGADLTETVSFTDYQGVRFVTLNSNYREAPEEEPEEWLSAQEEWLDQVLVDNPNDWTVVNFHHPLFPNRSDRDNDPLRERWQDTLEEHNVDLVLQGHDHSYARGNLVEHRTDDAAVQTGPVYAVAVTGPKMYEADEDLWDDNDAEARVQQEDTQTFQSVTVDGDTLEFSSRTSEGDTLDQFTIEQGGDGKRVTDRD